MDQIQNTAMGTRWYFELELEDFDANCRTNTHAVLVKISAHAEVHSVGESDGVFFVPEAKVVA